MAEQPLYRRSIEAFLQESQWQLQYPQEKRNMERVLHWFNRTVRGDVLDAPAEGRPTRRRIAAAGGRNGPIAFRPTDRRFTTIMSWMQAMRFSKPVHPDYYVAAGRTLVAFKDPPSDEAISKGPSNVPHHLESLWRSKWFVLVKEGDETQLHKLRPDGLGIPRTQCVPHVFVSRTDFTCLRTTAGDAFMSWTDTTDRYSAGGREQLFIWEAKKYLSYQGVAHGWAGGRMPHN